MKKFLYAFLCIAMCVCMPGVVNAQLAANFSAGNTSGCSPIVVQFTDQSTGSPTSWLWDLGNGTTSTLQNPSTVYVNAGTYTVTLTVSNGALSSTKTATSYITVLPSPFVNFIVSDSTAACTPDAVQFTNLSSTAGGGTPSYLWDFGDGITSNVVSPAHTYNNPGDYTVTLVVTSGNGCVKSLVKNDYIQAAQKPVANFSSNNNNSCTSPATVTFTNATTGGVSYQWNFGDGATSTASSPSHTYNTSGSYTVTLIATNALGCSDTQVITSFVNIGSLNASFTPSATATCTGNNISFSNTSTPGPGTSTWSFGDGATSTVASPTHAYAAAGTYTVKLVVHYNNCSDSTTQTITVNAGPVVAFTANNTYNCSAPFTVQFTNSTTGATSYAWTFGDGHSSTGVNPSNTYNVTGSFGVTLIATSANGCKDTLLKPSYITVNPPTATINATPSHGCAPLTVSYTTSLSPAVTPTSVSISFGDGTANGTTGSGSHVYTSAGTYVMTYTYTLASGCTGTAQTIITVGTPPVANFTLTPDTLCPGTPVTITNTSTGATSYSWTFGDGGTSTQTNPVYTYNDVAGTYTIVLTASNNGCVATHSKTVVVRPSLAKYSFTYSCVNRLQVSFHDSSAGATSWSWDFGDGNTSTLQNPVHTFSAYSTYSVVLTVTNSSTGCSNSKTKSITLYADPLTTYTITHDTGCIGTNVSFASNSSSNITSNYTWAFGDGGTGITSGNSTAHTYTTSGIYHAKVQVTDGYGCIDTLANTVKIGGATPAFTGTPLSGCVPLTVTFQDQSTDGAGVAITSRTWAFGNGSSNTGNNTSVSNTYTSGGQYTVVLKTTDAYGCTDSLVKPGYITASKPVAQFSSIDTSFCAGLAVAFTNTSTGLGTLSYAWTFGDGGTSTQTSPTHIYNAVGTYTVRLITTTSFGCSDTLVRTAYIHINHLSVGFTMSDSFATCPPLTTTMTNTSTGSNTYTWTFGNGGTSTLLNPTTVYTYPGNYTVTMVAHSSNGCIDSVSKPVTVLGPSGTLTYSNSNGCLPLTIQFSSVSQNATSFTWDMNNGYTQTTTNPSFTYTYTQPGDYVPILVLSNGTCQVPIIGADTIKADAVTADFTFSPASICQGGTINFSDTTLSSLSTINARHWAFGDGGTSTAHNPSHTYATAGTYSVKLIIGNTTGCLDTITKSLIVSPPPNVSAGTPQSICAGSSTPVQLQATGATTYVWTPATGLSCTACANPTALPTGTTTYKVVGTASSTCIDSATVTVTINPLPTINAGANQTVCSGTVAHLQATGGVSYVWSPATGLSCTACANPDATPSGTTTYTVTGTNANGCSNAATVTVNVNPVPTVGTGANVAICNGANTQLQATGANSYSWSPATGLSCTACAAPVAAPASTTTYVLTGTTNGCSDTAHLTVTVNAKPNVSAGNPQHICRGQTDSVLLAASGANTYSWSPAAGISCPTCVDVSVLPDTTTIYTVIGTLADGCSDTAAVTVTVNPLPHVSAGADQTVCNGSSAPLQATGSTSYVWTPAAGLSCATCASPTATPDSTTTYIVKGTDANGCSDTSSITVTVSPALNVTATANQTICNGDTAHLQATGGSTYIWAPTTGITCTTCAITSATPSATTTYTVTGYGGNGCSDTGVVTVTVNPLPTINATNQTICNGAAVNLNATGAATYSWSPATGLSCTTCANPSANPTITTIYTITGVGTSGCSDSSHVTVTVDTLPVVHAGNNQSICSGATAQLQATGATTYVWSPATGLSCTTCVNPIASPTDTTTYTVTGTNANGCSDTSTLTITTMPLPTVTVNNAAICSGASAQLQAGGANTYSWSPATGLSCTTCDSATANPTATTTYVVTGTATNGCTDTAHAVVTVNLLPTITANNQTICSGIAAQLQANGGVSYSWSPATGLSCTTCSNPLANPTVTTTYTVTGSNANGCIDSSHVTVTIDTLPIVSAGNNDTTCKGVSVQLHATGAINYSWSPAAGLSCTGCANPTANPAATTTYTTIGTNANGCADTATVVVDILPLPAVTASPSQSICKGASVQLSAGGAVSYTWSPNVQLSCIHCDSPVASPTATTTYTVTGTGSNGCTDTASVQITLYPQPVISGSPATVLCAGASAQLSATGGVSYTWSPATGLSCTNCDSPFTSIDSNIMYTVTGTDADGCKDSGTVGVTVIQQVPTTVSPSDTICAGQSVQLQATGGISYQWYPGLGLNEGVTADPITTPDITTTYTVLIKENQCFTDTSYVTIVVNPLPTISFGNGVGLTAGNSVTLSPVITGDIATYAWSGAGLSCDTCANPVVSPTATTTYTLDVVSTAGCKASGQVTITVGCDKSQIFIPNTFTPNGDGNNDRFYISGKGISTIKRFSVYDRWGELLFQAEDVPVNDQLRGWDGTYKGRQLPPDVYVYMVDAICETGQPLEFKGDISLVR